MKKNIFYTLTIIILTSFIFSSCTKFNLFSHSTTPYHYGIFKSINDTITLNYNDALSMLNDFSNSKDISNLTKAEWAEYHILLAEARYKCDSSQINKKTLNDIVLYLDSLTAIYPKKTDILLQNSRAHYYRGVGYR